MQGSNCARRSRDPIEQGSNCARESRDLIVPGIQLCQKVQGSNCASVRDPIVPLSQCALLNKTMIVDFELTLVCYSFLCVFTSIHLSTVNRFLCYYKRVTLEGEAQRLQGL